MNATDNSDSALLTINQAARMLSCCRSTLCKLLDSGDLSTTRVAADRRISRQAIQEFINTNTSKKGG